MANFGFRRLAVVAPFETHWREAKSAVGAPEVLKNAKETERLAEAVSDCTLVVGTGTLERRRAEQEVLPLPELGPRVTEELARGGRVALVFGSEKRGLTREDLARCHVLAVIPTDVQQPSMNLGQAVAVCLYEIAARGSEVSHPRRKDKNAPRVHPTDEDLSAEAPVVGHPELTEASHAAAPATAGEIERLSGVVEEAMAAANYSPPEMRGANRHDVHLLLRRLALSKRDTKRILGLFRRILWRLKHASK